MIAVRGNTKYGPAGLYTPDSFSNLNLPPEIRSTLASTANQAICQKSWSSYKTAMKMLERCLAEHGEQPSLPLPERQVALFVAWMLNRDLSAKTIRAYLSALKTMHTTRGMKPPEMRSPIIQHVLTGRENAENRDKKNGQKKIRLPMTPDLMLVLKKLIIKADLGKEDKTCYWSAVTLAFAGGFRMSELLCKKSTEYDPDYCLLTQDIVLKSPADGKASLQVKIKCDKTNKTHLAVEVDIFSSGSSICPVKAYKKYAACTNRESGHPAFRLRSGAALTAKKLNTFLKNNLTPYLGGLNGFISSHSFRIGISSLLANSGMSTEELKCIGRWSSSAYEFYLKLPRTSRLRLAERISTMI